MSLKKSEVVCKICGDKSVKIFDAEVLGKYSVDYYQCQGCKFIQTEDPYWLSEAYSSAITAIDVGLIYRNLQLSESIPAILEHLPNPYGSFLDYGGGYGIFVRIMRDKGYDFYLYDSYADNLFAKYFELENYKKEQSFESVTAFEVFEHLENPVEELKKMLSLSDTVIFSTELQSARSFSSASDWWYFAPETGQHVVFFSKESLESLADQYNLKLYTNNINLHVLTRSKLMQDPFNRSVKAKPTLIKRLVSRFMNKNTSSKKSCRASYLQADFELYKAEYIKQLNSL